MTQEDVPLVVDLASAEVPRGTYAYAIVTQPTLGSVSEPRGGQVLYTPAPDVSGTDAFTWQLERDGVAATDPVQVVVTVEPVNDVPVATPASVVVEVGTFTTLLLAGTDAEGADLDCTLGSVEPGQGDVTLVGCIATYEALATGQDGFTFIVDDGEASSAEGLVSVEVEVEGRSKADNTAPTMDDLDATCQEDGEVDIRLVAADAEGDPVVFQVVGQPRDGSVTIAGDVATYEPFRDFDGMDFFEVVATDQLGASAEPARVTVEVTAAEDPPVVIPTTYDLVEDTSLEVELRGEDPEGDLRLSYEIVADPLYVSATLDGDRLVLVPAPEWFGNDRMRVLAIDSAGNAGEPGVITIAVAAVDDAPVPAVVSAATDEGTSVDLRLSATDVDSAALTYAVVTGPANGSVSLSGDLATYTPTTGYSGVDGFTWSVSDGTSTVTSTASIDVVEVDSGVTLAGGTVVTREDEPGTADLVVTNEVGYGPYTYAVRSPPSHGAVTFAGDVVTFTPTADWSGDDTFSVQATDALGNHSSAGWFEVEVAPVDDVPTAADSTVTVDEDSTTALDLALVDVDGDVDTLTLVSGPVSGTARAEGGLLWYTPTAEWSGTDGVTWSASDGTSVTATVTTTIEVRAVNDAPVATDSRVDLEEDTTVSFVLDATDVEDGTALTWTVSTPPAHGDVTVEGATVTYVPDAEFSGADSLRWYARDSEGGTSEVATVTLIVSTVNDPPTPTTTAASCDENSNTSITLTASDPEGAPLSYAMGRAPTNGTARLTGGTTVRYTPDSNFDGEDSFTYTVSDGVNTATGTVVVTVQNTNGSPELSLTEVTGTEDEPLTWDIDAVDPDGDDITASVVNDPLHGEVSLKGLTATYTPDPDWNGSDSFRIRVVDTDGYATSGTAYVVITNVNDAPVAADQAESCDEDTALTFLLDVDDVDGDDLTFTWVREPAHGTITRVGERATYEPDEDYYGTDDFEYVATDPSGESTGGVVTLTVAGTPDAPELVPSALHTYEDNPVTFDMEVEDPDGDALTTTFTETPDHGTLVEADGLWTYTPDSGYVGRDFFSVTATDGTYTTDEVRFIVSVGPLTFFDREPSPQTGINKMLYGLGAEDGPETAPDPFNPDAINALLEELGAQVQRQLVLYDLVWSSVEMGNDNWRDPDENVALDHPTIETTATLFEIQYASPTPAWCTDNADFQAEMGEEAYEYLDYVLDHYTGMVNSFEIGNEMYHWVAADPDRREEATEDLPNCYPEDGYQPAEQAVFIQQAADYLKAANPDGLVTLASINSDSTSSSEWFDEVFTTLTDPDAIDVVSFHAYDTWQRSYYTRDELLASMEALGVEDKLVRLTEMGTTSDEDNTERTDYPNSDETQCADVFRLSLIAWGVGTATAMWHTLLPLTDGAGTGQFRGFELVEYDGTWKPSAYTYQLMTEELIPFKQVTEWVSGNRWVYRIVRRDEEVRWVMWGTRGRTVPEGVTEYTSVVPAADGTFTWTPVPEDGRLDLEEIPILLR